MAIARKTRAGWRGVCLVAITYVYFLIFAQFAFLKRLAELGIADLHLKAVMAAMATGGILLSLLCPRSRLLSSPSSRLRVGYVLTGLAALAILLPLNLAGAMATSFAIGAGLGIVTVTLVTYLRQWLGTHHRLLKVGLGTGLGYLACNLPALFTAHPQTQAITAAILCFSAIFIVSNSPNATDAEPSLPAASSPSFLSILLSFTALIWLDSAAFFIIQNTPALKAGTWEGNAHLWINGALHLIAALASAWLLRRRGLHPVLASALLALATACLLLLDPYRALLASAFYPIGVSLYSVALVAYPSLLLTGVSTAERGRRAGWIYAVGGWFGSAMGIGMGQNLGHVPVLFVLAASVIVLAPYLVRTWATRRRETLAAAALLLLAVCIHRTLQAVSAPKPPLTAAERGRQVYISEGCINCHSQYVRPHSPDVLLWGPVQTLSELRRERPPLIGNRRQGPDLAEVGSRRSPLWLRAHFYAPAQVSFHSFMPSYVALFRDQRGDDLIAYLQTLSGSGVQKHRLEELAWHPAASPGASIATGAQLFGDYCGTCHSPNGDTLRTWHANFHTLPPNLSTGTLNDLPSSDTPQQRHDRLARIVKFGLPGTDMPGHEYLSDADIQSLTLWLEQVTARPAFTAKIIPHTGENR
jgi:cytochrome c oxidase cbb3-type subunit 2